MDGACRQEVSAKLKLCECGSFDVLMKAVAAIKCASVSPTSGLFFSCVTFCASAGCRRWVFIWGRCRLKVQPHEQHHDDRESASASDGGESWIHSVFS